ncbi:MAG TPA: glycosyltransferase [Candidatus Omnitrophota bacterium]|nr:glycosyltransferase [Candidatus Omnitrophota bacterium]HPD84125.1 glycosyltransferase [Candidatus Omnitrophota bacterium]HRZ02982.1 glycosyltransferase [Candidatus Omnitrophota bacterium]
MKVLVIHTSAGAGHTKAAEAVYNGLKSAPGVEARLVDTLEFTGRIYGKLYQRGYTFLIKKMPWAWGIFFTLTDLAWLRGLVRVVRRISNSINARSLVDFLKAEQFDYIISTHFFPNEVGGHLKRRGIIRSKFICVVTDFDVHSIWLAQGIDSYAVASEYTKEKLITLGVEENKIFVTGIPTHEKFSKEVDRDQIKEKLGLRKDMFTVLIATGSFGIGPIGDIAQALGGNQQAIVVCGHNKNLFEKLSRQKMECVKVCGLVNNMDELMSVSDAMVTKPGGLSIAEALVKRLPLIFFSAIPGQETNNVRILKTRGIGISDSSINGIVEEIRKLSSSPVYLESVRKNVQTISRPRAVQDIIRLIV